MACECCLSDSEGVWFHMGMKMCGECAKTSNMSYDCRNLVLRDIAKDSIDGKVSSVSDFRSRFAKSLHEARLAYIDKKMTWEYFTSISSPRFSEQEKKACDEICRKSNIGFWGWLFGKR